MQMMSDHKSGLTLTLLCEGLFKDTLVKTAERSAEVFEVGEAELLVAGLRDGQTVLGLRGWRRRRLGGLLEAQGLGRRLRVAAHLGAGRRRERKMRKSVKVLVSEKYNKGLSVHFNETNKAAVLEWWWVMMQKREGWKTTALSSRKGQNNRSQSCK